MTDAPQLIRENAVYHSNILSAIAELDYVPSAITHQVAFVQDLELQLKQSTEKWEKLKAVTVKERKEHEKIRDAGVRRFAHKLVGKQEEFKAKESKEEREFLEALEQELMESNNQGMLRQLLDEAKAVEADLVAKQAQYESLKGELSDLYHCIFDGPTPEFHGEDKLELEFYAAQSLHEQIQKDLNAECQAVQLLTKADGMMNSCLLKMNEALGHNAWDVWGGGAYSEYLQSNALTNAQSFARLAEVLFLQAQHLSPQIEPVGEFLVPFEGSFLNNVIFDNFYTDLKFRDKIKEMTNQLVQVQNRMNAQRIALNSRADVAGNQLINAANELEESRRALHTFRAATFRALTPDSDGSKRKDDNASGSTAPKLFSPPPGPPPSSPPSAGASAPGSSTTIPPDHPPPGWSTPRPNDGTFRVTPDPATSTVTPTALEQGTGETAVVVNSTVSPLHGHQSYDSPLTQSPVPPPHWGTKNPYAAALSVGTQP